MAEPVTVAPPMSKNLSGTTIGDKMKTRFMITSLLLVGFVSSVQAGGISPGKYIFSAPSIYSSSDGTIVEWLSEVRITNGNTRLQILRYGGSDTIDFEVSDTGSIRVVGSRLTGTEISRRAKGSGFLTSAREAKGTITVISGVGPFWEKSTSEWNLRPATQKEIKENLKNREYPEVETKMSLLDWCNMKEASIRELTQHLKGAEVAKALIVKCNIMINELSR